MRSATAAERLEAATRQLAAAGVEAARADAEWLLAGLLGVGRAHLALALAAPLDAAVADRFGAAVERRARREPLQQILGWEAFRGLRLVVTGAVLVPRPETEILVEWALELLPPARPGPPGPVVVDVGTGSGCVACAIAGERPDVTVIATERAPAALGVAEVNVRALGLAGRVRLIGGELTAALARGVADLVVANPPYVPSALVETLAPEVRDWEPRGAIDGGPDGLAVLRPLVRDARRVLRPGGGLVVETAGGDQSVAVATLIRAAGFTAVALRRDLAGVDRLVAGRVPGPVASSACGDRQGGEAPLRAR